MMKTDYKEKIKLREDRIVGLELQALKTKQEIEIIKAEIKDLEEEILLQEGRRLIK